MQKKATNGKNHRRSNGNGSHLLGSSLKVLQILYEGGPQSQSRIAQQLGITPPAAFNHFQKLSEQGLVWATNERKTSARGRPRELWDINRRDNFTLGVCIEPPIAGFGLADFSNNLILQEQVDLSEITRLESLIEILDDFFRKALRYVSDKPGFLRSISLCLPGYVDVGKPGMAVNMPYLSSDALACHVREKYGIDCHCHKLASATSFGETIDVPSGLTVGVIIWDLGVTVVPCCNKSILFFKDIPGHKTRKISELGHLCIQSDGPPCTCGQNGCLEAFTGGWAIIKKLQRADIQKLSELIAAAQRNDTEVLALLRESARILGENLPLYIYLLGIEKLIVTGPLSQVFAKIQDDFEKGLRQRMSAGEVADLHVQASDNPLQNILNGACRLARHMYLYQDQTGECYYSHRNDIHWVY